MIVGEPQTDTHMHNNETLAVRDPDMFVAGGLNAQATKWQTLVEKHCTNVNASKINSWLKDGVSVTELFTRFKGNYQGSHFNSDVPPSMYFRNHNSCETYSQFIADTLMSRIENGSVKLLGEVGSCDLPKVIMPIVIEPSKLRMCHDERYINLWVKDCAFSLENLRHVPRLVSKNSKLFCTDEKSGYDHLRIREEDQTYFGIAFGGYVMVYTTLPFGFKASPYIYQTVGMVATSEVRSGGIGSIQYLDDRMYAVDDNVQAAPLVKRVVLLLTDLGYTLNLKKCVLIVSTCLLFLGFVVDSVLCTFFIPEDKKARFAALRDSILGATVVDLKTLQRFAGKCTSFLLMVPGAKLYTRCVNLAISQMSKNSRAVEIKGQLKEELEHWRFLDHWSGHVPWKSEAHKVINLASDASDSGYGVVVIENGKPNMSFGDYWLSEAREYIHMREGFAVLKCLQSLKQILKNSRVDFLVDNMNVVSSWNNQGSKNESLTALMKNIFEFTLENNVDLVMSYIASKSNPADFPSRQLSPQDCFLGDDAWRLVEGQFGPHSVDLMALESNAMKARDGSRLKYYSRYPTPTCAGVNVFSQDLSQETNPYVFPPWCMVMPLLRYLREQNVSQCTIVVPCMLPHPIWWPELIKYTRKSINLGKKGEKGVLWLPSRKGYVLDNVGLAWDLQANRLVFPDL